MKRWNENKRPVSHSRRSAIIFKCAAAVSNLPFSINTAAGYARFKNFCETKKKEGKRVFYIYVRVHARICIDVSLDLLEWHWR